MTTAVARHLQTEPVTESDEQIAAYLDTALLPLVIASVVHITGDPSWLRGPIRPNRFVPNDFGGAFTEEEKAELVRSATAAIAAWRDAGCPAPAPLAPELVRELMDWLALEHHDDATAEMILEEMDLDGEDPRAIRIAPEAADHAAEYPVLVIGCGMGGLLAAIRLKQAGIPFSVVDKNTDVGGTWWLNTYPGARVDVASHYYSYSFEPNQVFTEYYARQPELHAYFRDHFDKHGIGEHVRWQTEVVRAAWDDAGGYWDVELRTGDGAVETLRVRAVISAAGTLHKPFIPDLPGLERFAGPVMHSAEWDSSVDLTGKKVALIGAGASGFQIGPAIVDRVAQLTVFQRSPQWMAPNPKYHDAVPEGAMWAARHLPCYSRWHRFMIMTQSSDKLLELVRMDPTWSDFPRTANAFSAERRKLFEAWIDTHVGDDPELKAKVTPQYPPAAKRMLQDNGSWLRCLKQPHVTLDTSSILQLEEGAVVTAEGRYEADVLVLATGFRANELLAPMEFVGRDGIPLSKVWDGKPTAYAGVTVAGFPNFFMIGGPGTGLAHAGSIVFAAECQMKYIGEALRQLVESGKTSIEPTEEAYERYVRELHAEMDTLMWGHESIANTWYKAPDGKIYILNPYGNVHYWRTTSTALPADHVLR
ncbi:flavin-containing monooxygenase [Trujillonella endophytica]|uniref:4-hydroxyacetophenone monooxygenase n=1 Tax=Trujillonella endophytica TaxID=673521 RepID=A0A1H8SVQ7_9ACTN|nr:NAD(P)/FAD-dependent oxidoreductase [Trujillella endophytica]SEO83069.1 4-hydroxyacetophenone monooxygenase [Trujillella endophytica]